MPGLKPLFEVSGQHVAGPINLCSARPCSCMGNFLRAAGNCRGRIQDWEQRTAVQRCERTGSQRHFDSAGLYGEPYTDSLEKNKQV